MDEIFITRPPGNLQSLFLVFYYCHVGEKSHFVSAFNLDHRIFLVGAGRPGPPQFILGAMPPRPLWNSDSSLVVEPGRH